MSLTAAVWALLFCTLAFLTLFKRASWGIPLYLLPYFAMPNVSWWGHGVLSSFPPRWSLLTAAIFFIGVLIDRRGMRLSVSPSNRLPFYVLLIYAINATLVHALFASDPVHSKELLVLLWKQMLLVYLMLVSIRDASDFRLFRNTLIAGGAYIGAEVVLHGVGTYTGGRLHQFRPLTEASDGAYVSCLLAMTVFFAAHLALTGKLWEKLIAVASAVLATEVLLRCNVRAAFLGISLGAAYLFFRAPGKMKRQVLIGGFLAVIGVLSIMGEEQYENILGRMRTGLAQGEEERDESAASRFVLWSAGLQMVADYPLGSGGEAAFDSPRGAQYMSKTGLPYFAVHNGYIDIAASWGVQGLALLMTGLLLCAHRCHKSAVRIKNTGDINVALLAFVVEAMLIQQLFSAIFVSGLKGEWFFWWSVLALRCEVLIPPQTTNPAPTIPTQSAPARTQTPTS